jgi:2-amino-4-hydroxy-6-hydroxymethyldihydropteridine diphosphokinase
LTATGAPARVFVALGSNLGDRAGYLAAARAALDGLPGTRLVAASTIEETEPLGDMDQPAYLNQMLLLQTTMPPRELMHAGQAIEEAHGRVRLAHWGSRTLDIDIVRYGDLSLAEPDLVLPHPGLAMREFWQREIAELETHER